MTYSTDNVTVLFNSSALNISNTARALRAVSELDVQAIEFSNGSASSLRQCMEFVNSVVGFGGSGQSQNGAYSEAYFENTTTKNNVVLTASSNVVVDSEAVEIASILKKAGAEIVTVAVNVAETLELSLQQISSYPPVNNSFTCQGTSELSSLVEVVSTRLVTGR